MAQFIEVTEEEINGSTHETAITKGYVVHNIKDFVAEGSKTRIFLKGKSTKDSRLVSEDRATVLAAANAAATANVETVLDLVVKAKSGDLEERTTPYNKGFQKNDVVSFYADPQDANDSIIELVAGKNDAETPVYTVDDTYASISASYDA